MDWIVLEGVRPWDGRYPLDLDGEQLTTREWGYIKRLTGYLPLTAEDGFTGGDPELFAAFAVIALVRAGQIDKPDVQATYDKIADAPAGATVRLVSDTADDDEGDERPPPGRPAGSGNTSGDGSPTSSETSEPAPNGSGTPGSAGPVSGSPTLASSHRSS